MAVHRSVKETALGKPYRLFPAQSNTWAAQGFLEFIHCNPFILFRTVLADFVASDRYFAEAAVGKRHTPLITHSWTPWLLKLSEFVQDTLFILSETVLADSTGPSFNSWRWRLESARHSVTLFHTVPMLGLPWKHTKFVHSYDLACSRAFEWFYCLRIQFRGQCRWRIGSEER